MWVARVQRYDFVFRLVNIASPAPALDGVEFMLFHELLHFWGHVVLIHGEPSLIFRQDVGDLVVLANGEVYRMLFVQIVAQNIIHPRNERWVVLLKKRLKTRLINVLHVVVLIRSCVILLKNKTWIYSNRNAKKMYLISLSNIGAYRGIRRPGALFTTFINLFGTFFSI